jgi:TIGR03009 family protein
MPLRCIASMLLGAVLTAIPALAQTNPMRGPEGPDGAYGPDQPVRPRVPRLQQRPAPPPAPQQPAPPQPPPPPFTLTPQEEAQVDRVLNLWEQHNRDIKTFECEFKRWVYDLVFARRDRPLEPKFIELGIIKYAAPDRGLFRIDKEEKEGKQAAIEDGRAEHWLCDGKSVYQYIPATKQVKEHRLPPELRGKAIANSPLPFLFGAEAQNLKQRYFIRLVAPPPGVNDQVWLEAYPRFQQDAGNFRRATFIITAKDLSPIGLELIQPNGKDYVTYRFDEIVVNAKFRLFLRTLTF